MNKTQWNMRQRAQGMVEFALAIPIFLVLAFGIIEFARMVVVYSSVFSAAREAARLGSAVGDSPNGLPFYRDCDYIRAAAQRAGMMAGIEPGNIDIRYDHGPDDLRAWEDKPVCSNTAVVALGDRVVVRVNADYVPLVGLVNLAPVNVVSTDARTIVTGVNVQGTPPNTPTPAITKTPTRTATITLTPTPSETPTPTPTNTEGPSPTPTDTPTPTNTFTPTNTPTNTSTPTPTDTPGPAPTATPSCDTITFENQKNVFDAASNTSTSEFDVKNPLWYPYVKIRQVTVYWGNNNAKLTNIIENGVTLFSDSNGSNPTVSVTTIPSSVEQIAGGTSMPFSFRWKDKPTGIIINITVTLGDSTVQCQRSIRPAIP